MQIPKSLAPILFAFAGICSLAAPALAQTFPGKPLSMMVAWPPGGGHDFAARLLSRELNASLGQPVIVENAPGAGGTLGINKALKAPADGYTLMITSPTELILSPLTFASAQYTAEDVRTIAIAGRTGVMLVTRKDLPVSSLTEFVALLKSSAAKPLSYCTPGLGSLYHLIGEKLNLTAGVKTLHVPYTGFTQCATDLAGGNTVDFAFLPVAGPFPGFVDNGSIKPIAMLSDAPSNRFPKMPLASGTAGFDGFAFAVWVAVHVSAKVPDAVADVLHKHVSAALAKPEVRAAMEGSGSAVPPPMTLRQAQDEYLKDIRAYTAIANAVGLTRK